MGWGRMMLLGNIGQQMDIGDLNKAIAEMQSASLENRQTDLKQELGIAGLRRENRELKMYLATVIRLLVAKGVLSADEMRAVVQAIEPDERET